MVSPAAPGLASFFSVCGPLQKTHTDISQLGNFNFGLLESNVLDLCVLNIPTNCRSEGMPNLSNGIGLCYRYFYWCKQGQFQQNEASGAVDR